MPTPKADTPYTRTQIQEMVGGELQTYLPQRDKVILAGCFAVDAMNPDAPETVQPGKPPRVAEKALLLASQPSTVFPVFLKRSTKSTHYYFVGYYSYRAHSTDPSVIAAAEARSGRHGELSCVLYLKPHHATSSLPTRAQ